MKITVGVVAHIASPRAQFLLEKTLNSLANMKPAEGVELKLIVLDNGSPSENRQIFRDRTGFEFARLESREIGAARDYLTRILAKDSEWCGFVDADIEVPEGWLQSLVKRIRDITSEGFSPSIIAAPIGAIASVNRPPRNETLFSDALDLFLGSNLGQLGSTQARQSKRAEKVSHLSACAVLYRHSALIDVGGFDPAFSFVCEDLELSYRLREKSRLFLLAEPVVTHRQDESEWPWMKRMFRYGWGQIEVMRKHRRHAFSAKILPPLAIIALAAALSASFEGKPQLLLLMLVAYFGLILVPLALRGFFGRRYNAPAMNGRILTTMRAMSLAIATHLAYGLGSFAGVLGLFRNESVIQRSDARSG